MNNYFQHNKWRLAAAGCCLLMVYLFWGYLLPQFNQTIQLYSDLQDQKAKIASVKNWRTRLNRLNDQQQKFKDYLSKIFLNLPKNDQMSTIVNQVFKQAKSGSVKITQMKPEEQLQYDTYLEIPISLQVQGSYHEIGRFVNRIEHSGYLMKVGSVKITSGDQVNARLNARLAVRVIILKRSTEGSDSDG
jgi:type IV pilus assembly protein PilO